MNLNEQMRHCLDTLIELVDYPPSHPKEIVDLFGKAMRRFEKQGYKIPEHYKNKYKEYIVYYL